MRGAYAGWVLTVLCAALAACGGEQAAEAPRPVLVAHPGGGEQAALATFAGEVHAREESPLSFRIGGNLVRRDVDAGARVHRGDVLAVLDPGDASLQARAARAELVRLQGDLDRYRKLVAQKLVSQSAFDAQQAAYESARAQYEVARNQTAYTQLRAPRDGVIASRLAEAGQVVAAGQTVFTLAADGGREVVIALPEAHIREFGVGQPAQVELWSAPGRRLPGPIREIAPAADAQTRTYLARVALDGDAAQAVDLGQSARVFVQRNGLSAALGVPLSAVQRGDGGATSVWVVDAKTRRLRAQPVQLGPYGETEAPVLKGLTAADWVVAAGGHLLREGQQVVAVDRSNKPVLPAPAAVAKAE
ncbi:efflux transporter periplasmic adaptor subunit [Pseudoxanthomonas sangjuensis]|uniref:efflux RND transporter periplasmic adaptor subunit n=1 Tax=Pseudoxanthomonas sangjuensis TaxID=1503750 RepID=UPI001390BEDB|nr:efflux RND transporter periplasmic adaptor subunit [Pseudoxanthomonas sangjuensis]KAF1714075.1 efflux transporter periplasmic adaptor subunit [Pseudoxanthomonas sangjuensis]